MIIDCNTCTARDIACHDCVISVLLASPPAAGSNGPGLDSFVGDEPGGLGYDGTTATAVDLETVDLDESARYALGNLARAGLVPPLRLVASLPARDIA